MLGSVWLGSPWLRMQEAHSTRKPVASFPVAVVALRSPPLVPVEAVEVFVLAMFATDGGFDPPQPAASRPRTAIPASAKPSRPSRGRDERIPFTAPDRL